MAAIASASSSALRHQLVVGDDAGHEPDPQRLVGVDQPAGEEQVGGDLAPDELRQAAEPGDVAAQAALHEQLAEPGALGRDADVGHQRQLHPPADGGAVDGRDDGHVGGEQGGRGGREPRLGGEPLGDRRTGRHHDLLHVVTRAERRIGTGDDEASGGRRLDRPAQLVVGGVGQRVARLGPVRA